MKRTRTNTEIIATTTNRTTIKKKSNVNQGIIIKQNLGTTSKRVRTTTLGTKRISRKATISRMIGTLVGMHRGNIHTHTSPLVSVPLLPRLAL